MLPWFPYHRWERKQMNVLVIAVFVVPFIIAILAWIASAMSGEAGGV
jgi:hypothetical protein